LDTHLPSTLQDTDSVVNSLETGLGLLVHFVFFALYLLVWGVNIVQGFTTFSATALALTFIFGDALKSVFEVRRAPVGCLPADSPRGPGPTLTGCAACPRAERPLPVC
jgi:hypothetical protein